MLIISVVFFCLQPGLCADLQEKTIINSQSYVFEMDNGVQRLGFDIPAGSIGMDAVLKVSFNPLVYTYNLDKVLLADSLNSLGADKKYFSGHLYEVSAYAGGGYYSGDFTLPVKLTAYYPDSDDDGVVDGSDPIIFENNLKAYYLDSDNQWVVCEGQNYDFSLNTVSFLLKSPACAALIGQVSYSQGPGNARIYPNPVKLNGPLGGRVNIANLPLNAEIKIYTFDGGLVKELSESDTDGKVEWNLQNTAGKNVASGIYIAVVRSGTGRKIYKIAVER